MRDHGSPHAVARGSHAISCGVALVPGGDRGQACGSVLVDFELLGPTLVTHWMTCPRSGGRGGPGLAAYDNFLGLLTRSFDYINGNKVPGIATLWDAHSVARCWYWRPEGKVPLLIDN